MKITTSMKTKKLRNCLLATLAISISSSQAATYIYDFRANVGDSGVQLSTDGWTGQDIGNWITGDFQTERYARNANDGDNIIYRVNDDGFSFNIPVGTTSLILEIGGRLGLDYFRTGLGYYDSDAEALTTLLGVGRYGSGNDNKYFVLNDSGIITQTNSSSTNDANHTLTIDLDLLANTVQFYRDGVSLFDEAQAFTVDLNTANSLFVQTNSRYVGPGTFTITAIPEPSTMGLLVLGALAFGSRRRKQKR